MDGKSLARFARGKGAPRREAPAAAPAAAPAQSLPPPQPGYAWAWSGNQYVMVPLQGMAPAPAYQPPAPYGYPPGTMTAPQPSGPGAQVIPLRPRSNALVRDDGKDLWAEKLEQIPDLPVAPAPGTQGYDAMAGRPSPLSVEALRPLLNEDPEARAAHAYSDMKLEHDPKFRPAPDLVDRGAGRE